MQREYGSYKLLEAETFNLVDSEGTARVTLQTLSNGALSLSMHDANEDTRIGLSVSDKGTSMITLDDEDGNSRNGERHC